ncbi:MAG: hypothetical protein OCD76_07915 [Reichenbachiella sp.]
MNKDSFDDLVIFGEFVAEEKDYRVALDLNPEHNIFEGHFPERSILPGVIMAEIIRRAVSYVTEKDLRLKSAHNIKFLKMVEPDVISSLVLQFSVTKVEEDFKVKASLSVAEDIFFKEQAVFQLA